jgi:triphosphoribosyl-dephospho-CoA synthetase
MLERYRDTAILVRHGANVLDEARRHARACLSH